MRAALPAPPPRCAGDVEDHADLFRMVACTSGEVEVLQELRIRFEYGLAVPWVRKGEDVDGEPVLIAIAGGDAVALHGPALTAGEGRCHEGRHRLRAGEETAWILTWFPSWLEVPPARDPRTELERTCAQWTGWLGQVRVDEEHARPVERSLLGAAGADPSPHRRDRRRGHHQPPRGLRRGAQLGLPLLLAARRRAVPRGAADARTRGRRRRVARMAAAGDRGRSRASADHVLDHRGPANCPSRSSGTCPATRARSRCGSATAPQGSSRPTWWAR